MRRGSARTVRRPRTGGVCGQDGRKDRLSCQIEAQRSGFDLERRSNGAQPKKRRTRQRLPFLSRAKFAPTRPQEVYKNSRPPSLVFSFSQNAPFRKMQKCVIARKRPSRFLVNLDSPDRAKSGSPDLRNGAFSSYPIPQGRGFLPRRFHN